MRDLQAQQIEKQVRIWLQDFPWLFPKWSLQEFLLLYGLKALGHTQKRSYKCDIFQGYFYTLLPIYSLFLLPFSIESLTR